MKRVKVAASDEKKIIFESLGFLDEVCRKHHWIYYIAYGTLLGAVRHHGFIPWDDDIDVWMQRKDYDQLLAMSAELETDRWKFYNYRNDPGFYLSWTVLCDKETEVLPSRFNSGYTYGVGIDIFPLDYCAAESRKEAQGLCDDIYNRYLSSVKAYKPYSGAGSGETPNKIKQILRKDFNILKEKTSGSLASVWREIEDDAKKLGGSDAPYIVSMFNSAIPRIFNRLDFETVCELPFEDKHLPAPTGYDAILRERYGDYMQLPPEDQRVSNHYYQVFYKSAK